MVLALQQQQEESACRAMGMGLADLVIDAISALVLSHETWKQRFEDSFFCVRQEKVNGLEHWTWQPDIRLTF